jgi:hypothetical protein
MRSAVLATRTLLNVAIKLMNHFPLFALLLRTKDPRRLPGSYLQLHRCGQINDRKGSTYFRVVSNNGYPMLVLEVTPLPCSDQAHTNLFIPNDTDTNCVLLGSLHATRIFTAGHEPASCILKRGPLIYYVANVT